MLEPFKEHINSQLPFLFGKRLLIACSAGLDSVVLTELIHQLGYEIGLIHCNFSLRGEESDGDEAFVMELAKKLEVPFFIERFDTKSYAKSENVSIQMAARALRYRWFEEIRTDFKFDYILTAHHADDNLETFLINVSRGAGIRGLTGIKTVSDSLVRPLLPFSRTEILDYAKHQNLYWREDSSNAKSDYLRNAIRHHVIPAYKKEAPGLLDALDRTQHHLSESALLIEDYLALIYKLVISETEDGYQIDILKLSELPNTNAILYELLHPFGFTAWKDISDLLAAQSGKTIASKTHRLLKDRTVLLLTEIHSEEINKEFLIQKNTKNITHPIKLSFNSIEKIGNPTATTVYVDSSKLSYPLKVRKWKAGDIFQPFGMDGKKKLSKFFKDEKLSLVAKEKIWVLESDDKIVWVIGRRLDDRFKVNPETKEILKITLN